MDGFSSQDVLMSSLGDGFINKLNDFIPPQRDLLYNEDGYEILSDAFGRKFRKKDLENTTKEQVEIIVNKLSKAYNITATSDDVYSFLNGAMRQSFEVYKELKF